MYFDGLRFYSKHLRGVGNPAHSTIAGSTCNSVSVVSLKALANVSGSEDASFVGLGPFRGEVCAQILSRQSVLARLAIVKSEHFLTKKRLVPPSTRSYPHGYWRADTNLVRLVALRKRGPRSPRLKSFLALCGTT
jgi:hypothetical protein